MAKAKTTKKIAQREQGFNVRTFGLFNAIGLWTLYVKEVRRFTNIYLQTIIAPLVTNLLFFAVFSLALGGAERMEWGIPFMTFLAPGIIMMAIAQNAFTNSSSILVISKVQGNIVDMLMVPISVLELVLAFIGAAITRGLAVGLASIISIYIFHPLPVEHLGWILTFAVSASAMMGLVGMITGIWGEKFDHLAAVTNFIITPLTFLSGTFYSISVLPEFWFKVAHFNPFFYMIDGFRYGFLGQSDSSPWLALTWLSVTNIILFAICYGMLKKGYKIKS